MKILLFSDCKKIYDLTQKIAENWFELVWCKFDDIKRNQYPEAEIVIIHFDRIRIQEGSFETIIKIKGKMGALIPILTIIEGTKQEIFSVLKSGAYDYITIEMLNSIENYKRKLNDIILWDWHTKRMEREKK